MIIQLFIAASKMGTWVVLHCHVCLFVVYLFVFKICIILKKASVGFFDSKYCVWCDSSCLPPLLSLLCPRWPFEFLRQSPGGGPLQEGPAAHDPPYPALHVPAPVCHQTPAAQASAAPAHRLRLWDAGPLQLFSVWLRRPGGGGQWRCSWKCAQVRGDYSSTSSWLSSTFPSWKLLPGPAPGGAQLFDLLDLHAEPSAATQPLLPAVSRPRPAAHPAHRKAGTGFSAVTIYSSTSIPGGEARDGATSAASGARTLFSSWSSEQSAITACWHTQPTGLSGLWKSRGGKHTRSQNP